MAVASRGSPGPTMGEGGLWTFPRNIEGFNADLYNL